MNSKRGCLCCEPVPSFTEESECAEEEEEISYDVVADIWRNKMLESGLFLSSEIEVILTVWIKFIRKVLQHNIDVSAEDFYMSVAVICAQQLRHYSEHGWQCLLKNYAPTVLICFENSIEEQEAKEPSVSSEEYSCDVHKQVEFLLQLVASSNVSLHLVRMALSKTFAPNFSYVNSPHKLYVPRNYLESNLESLNQEQIRKNLIYGTYDGYILPLQIANEVNDEFWKKECEEICRFKKIDE